MRVVLFLSIFISLLIGAGIYGVIQQIVNTSTFTPESEWYCLKGKVETFRTTGPYGTSSVVIIGDQLICGRDWKISGIFGPTGFLDDHPEEVITFGDLQNLSKPQDENKD